MRPWETVVYRNRFKYIWMHVTLYVGEVDKWWIHLWNKEACTSYQMRFNYKKTFTDPKVAMRRALKIAKRIYREDKAEE